MPAIGGSIESVTLDGREFPVAADAESNRKLGGFENEVQPNGDGSARLIKTRVAWMADGLSLENDDDRGDQEFLQELANRTNFFPMLVSYASGKTYQGTGQIVGEIQSSSQSAFSPITLSGSLNLSAQ